MLHHTGLHLSNTLACHLHLLVRPCSQGLSILLSRFPVSQGFCLSESQDIWWNWLFANDFFSLWSQDINIHSHLSYNLSLGISIIDGTVGSSHLHFFFCVCGILFTLSQFFFLSAVFLSRRSMLEVYGSSGSLCRPTHCFSSACGALWRLGTFPEVFSLVPQSQCKLHEPRVLSVSELHSSPVTAVCFISFLL